MAALGGVGSEAAWSRVLSAAGSLAHALGPLLFEGAWRPRGRVGGDGAELKMLNDLWLLRPVAAAAPVSAAELTAAGGARQRSA